MGAEWEHAVMHIDTTLNNIALSESCSYVLVDCRLIADPSFQDCFTEVMKTMLDVNAYQKAMLQRYAMLFNKIIWKCSLVRPPAAAMHA